MLQHGVLGLFAEDELIASVRRCALLVEFLLVDGQRLVGDVEIDRRATAVAGLCEDVEHVAVGEGDAVVETQYVLVRPEETGRRLLAHHIVAGVRVVVVGLVVEVRQHLEGGRKRLGQCLADGGLRERCHAPRHQAHIFVHLGGGDVTLAGATAEDGILLLGGQKHECHLSRVHVHLLLPISLRLCHFMMG